jgi:HEAT repeat protein
MILSSGCAVFGPGGPKSNLEGLKSPEPKHRIKALSGLEGQVTPQMRMPLENILQEDVSPTARAMAADALGELGAKESVKELRLSARRDGSWVVRRRSLEALVQIQGQQVREDLEYTLKNEANETVRAEAVKLAAQHLGGQARTDVLLLGLRDESEVVRLTAHEKLSRITGEDIPPGDHPRWKEALQGE